MGSKKKNLSRKQVALLRKVKKHILEVPNRLVMRIIKSTGLMPGALVGSIRLLPVEWGSASESKDVVPECGTVGCIKGWAEEFDPILARKSNFRWMVSVGLWPPKLRTAYRRAKTAERRAKLAGEAIDYFIKIDGRDWRDLRK